jgi:DNA polymerase-3 subunit alpha
VKAHNVNIEPIKFGKSGAEYTMDKENNIIFKGIASIKFCNAQIASELLNLYNEIHNKKIYTFIDLLDDINEHTSLNKSQLEILTTLDFFSDFGNNKYLLDIIKIYNGVKEKNPKTKKEKTLLPSIRNCKQLKKDDIEIYEKFGLTEYLIKKYSGKETAKQYRDIDNMGLLQEMIERIPNKTLPIVEQCKAEKEYLQYVIYSNPKLSEYYYIVVDYMTYQDETKPRMTLRNLKTGEEISTRIKQGKIYRNNPFGLYSILEIQGFTMDFKKKCIAGEWQTTDELEPILEEYDVIKNDEI